MSSCAVLLFPLLSPLFPSAVRSAALSGPGSAQGPQGRPHKDPQEWGCWQPHSQPGQDQEAPAVPKSICPELDLIPKCHSKVQFTTLNITLFAASSSSFFTVCRACTSASWHQYNLSRTQKNISVTKSWWDPLPGSWEQGCLYKVLLDCHRVHAASW